MTSLTHPHTYCLSIVCLFVIFVLSLRQSIIRPTALAMQYMLQWAYTSLSGAQTQENSALADFAVKTAKYAEFTLKSRICITQR